MKIVGLMACDPNGLVGKDKALPWHYPEELAHFRATTQNQILIMGRKTFESLPEALFKERYVIVLSRHQQAQSNDRLFFLTDLPEQWDIPGLPKREICYMIGGAETARIFLEQNRLSAFILTGVHQVHFGNIFLPELLTLDWPCKPMQYTSDFSIDYYLNPRSMT